jgi:hypothetical protein
MALVLSAIANAQTQDAPTPQFKYVEVKTIALKQVFQTKNNWHVTAYKPQGDDAETGDLPVKICFWFEASKDGQDCTSEGSKEYPHQNLGAFSIVPLIQSNHPLLGVLIETFFSGGGSGIARTVSVLTYDAESDVFSSVASFDINEISDYKVIDSGTLGGSIVTASGLWQLDEGHWGDHRFWIQVYKYSEYYGRYEKYIGYLTRDKYPSEKLGVIEKELSAVSRIAATVYGNNDPLKPPIGAKVDVIGDSVVSLFYKALETADGDLAATYIIPEKRLIGAFAPQNMTRFYSTLALPLKLVSVENVGQGMYEARYNFVEKLGRHCDGRSVVTTIHRNGSELIAGIKSLSGC